MIYHYTVHISHYFYSSTAPPSSPFPIIKECMHHGIDMNCSLITWAANITCSVFRYFPSISLAFWHESNMMPIMSTIEESNSDGTRNMSIRAAAAPSSDPFICVASGIPGNPYQQQGAFIMVSSPATLKSTTEETTLVMLTDPRSNHEGTNISEYSSIHVP